MRRRWRLRPCPTDAAAALCRELGIRPVLASLLASRGITDAETASAFLAVRLDSHLRSPMLFRQMPTAASRIVEAISRGERIGIHGDYDVDGMSGSAILVRFLRALGHEPELFIPHRMRDGYGLKESGVRALEQAGVRLMITVDCGGCSHAEIALARDLGIDTIVCDHHQVSGTPLPALAVLNPIEPDAGFPFQGLCGAGVAFYLCLGVRMHLREQGHSSLPDLRRSLDLVTLGTIADIVPLISENRVMVKHGLRELMQSGSPGIVALKEISRITSTLSAGDVGFRLAPRLNASGRLSDARRGVELLTTSDVERARQLATELDADNRARQEIEREMVREALEQVERDPQQADRRSIVLASGDWHPGVIGIVAARLVDRYHRPTVLIAVDENGIGRGSGRSIAGVNLYRTFGACREHLLGFGGHHMAAGLTIDSERVGDFAIAFDAAVQADTRAADFVPETWVDAELTLSDIDDPLLHDLERLEPFGQGNPEPVFLLRSVEVAARRTVGEHHLKLLLRQGTQQLSAIAFRMADEAIGDGDRIDVLCSVRPNEWNGNITLESQIREWRPSTEI